MPIDVTKYYILAGNLPSAYSSATSVMSSIVKKNPYEIFSIPSEDAYYAMIIPEWDKGAVYSSFGNVLGSSYGSLVLYGDYVYICLSNNTNNLLDQYNPSNTVPTDKTKNEDGYFWIKYFEWDSSKKSGNYIKIPAFDNLEKVIDSTSFEFCNTTNAGVTGTCAFYEKTDISATILASMQTTCDICTDIANSLIPSTLYLTFLAPEVDVEDTISLSTRTEKLNNLKSDRAYNLTNFEIKSINTGLASGITFGSIVGLFLDPDFVGTTNATVPVGITVGFSGGTGNTGGTGGYISFILVNTVGGTTADIAGISLTSYGFNYNSNVAVTVSGVTTGQATAIQNAITIVIPSNDYSSIGGVSTLFNAKEQFASDVVFLINAKLKAYSDSGITYNYYALVKNSENNSLPVTITGVKHINAGLEQQSDKGIYYNLNFTQTPV